MSNMLMPAVYLIRAEAGNLIHKKKPRRSRVGAKGSTRAHGPHNQITAIGGTGQASSSLPSTKIWHGLTTRTRARRSEQRWASIGKIPLAEGLSDVCSWRAQENST
jgi:hypothetical protein